jgi:N-acetylmuramic acid 6-phosphate etherase
MENNSVGSTAVPITEQENPNSTNLSSLSTAEIVRLMNEEDGLVAAAVCDVLTEITRAVDGIVQRLSAGGRLFYIGTGTSGRLGVLDASECPPTFGVSPDLVQGVIAGGYDACYRAVEASEDDATAGERDLRARGFTKDDVLVGIAASGRTPYTVGALSFARGFDALTIAITCVPESAITRVAEISIVPVVGPEVLTGSTRLKAGTAQKMVLNMLSTAAMARLGHVYENLMIDVKASNQKVSDRIVRILAEASGKSLSASEHALRQAGHNMRIALIMLKHGVDAQDAKKKLAAAKGNLHEALDK